MSPEDLMTHEHNTSIVLPPGSSVGEPQPRAITNTWGAQYIPGTCTHNGITLYQKCTTPCLVLCVSMTTLPRKGAIGCTIIKFSLIPY